MAEPNGKTKAGIPSFRDKKRAGERLTMIPVYDSPFARLVDRSSAEMIPVGDSPGMVIQGLEHTNPTAQHGFTGGEEIAALYPTA
jgi:3-methyl-2-oxobutanoate hydroxymethyltransferase